MGDVGDRHSSRCGTAHTHDDGRPGRRGPATTGFYEENARVWQERAAVGAPLPRCLTFRGESIVLGDGEGTRGPHCPVPNHENRQAQLGRARAVPTRRPSPRQEAASTDTLSATRQAEPPATQAVYHSIACRILRRGGLWRSEACGQSRTRRGRAGGGA